MAQIELKGETIECKICGQLLRWAAHPQITSEALEPGSSFNRGDQGVLG